MNGLRIETVTATQWGPAQYAWSGPGPSAHPTRTLPPPRLPSSPTLALPPTSITIVVWGG